MAHSTDLLPTFASLTNTTTDSIQLDGVDLTPLLFNGKSLPQRMLFWRAGEAMAVRSGPWKLYRKGERVELYNLDEDLGEKFNLASEQPEWVDRLSEAWHQWESEVNESAEEFEK
jgi:arylsulfatase A-like enzyme